MAADMTMDAAVQDTDRATDRGTRLDRLRTARLYVCTDSRSAQGDLPEFLDAAYAGGVDIIQLRDKGLEARAEIEALEVLRDAATPAREALLRQRPRGCGAARRRRCLPRSARATHQRTGPPRSSARM
ncbi:thiamine phosphate synthase [Brevibacterium sp. UCMA 11754]|uniref:thiamine phosphate synthase n=1 Tax=Brevibacterium sp. UCMA 11754 TaxID=2749198 RepID=UPI003FA47A40